MTACAVLGAIGVLVGLLVHGRVAPAVLFSVWGAGFMLFGLVEQNVFLAGFTNPALATLVLLLLVSLVLERTAALDRLAELIVQGGPERSALRLSACVVPLSAFLNNTAVVSTLMGVIGRQRQVPPSRLLIPLSYTSILGGITTLVGTSTNLVVNSFVVQAGMPALGMFSFAWVGVPVALLCIGMLVWCVRFLPEHGDLQGGETAAFFLEAKVLPESPLIGRSIEDNRMRRLDGLFLLEILRDERLISPVNPNEVIAAGDVLIFSGETQKVQALQRFEGLALFGNHANRLLRANLVEVVISSESELASRTLREVDFRTMFDAGVVGIRRGNRQLTGQLGQVHLRVGDSLLLAVGADFWQHRNLDRNFLVLSGSLQRPQLSNRQSVLALGGFASVVALATLGWVPLLYGLLVLLGVFLAARLITEGELRRRFPFELVLIIGSALAIAQAMMSSGASAVVAAFMHAVFSGYGAIGALIGVYLITVVLTELVTNNAAAALAFPLALSTAQAFGVDPLPFVMVVAYGASACFLLPFGYQTHLMVYSPGRYRVLDFVRTGAPVSLVYGIGVLLLVPVVFPLG